MKLTRDYYFSCTAMHIEVARAGFTRGTGNRSALLRLFRQRQLKAGISFSIRKHGPNSGCAGQLGYRFVCR
ncbi:hypothetical protein ACSS6W_008681 [Trichoderma asperelloides]